MINLALGELKNLSFVLAEPVCALFQLQEKTAQELPKNNLTIEDFLNWLANQQFYPDMIKVLAHALPKKLVLQWTIQCIQTLTLKSPAEHTLLENAQQYIPASNDTLRRILYTQAEKLAFASPVCWLAAALYWSDGSLSPPGAPVTPPPLYLYAHAVAGAVMLAAVYNKPEQAATQQQIFIIKAVNLAKGDS